MKYAVLLTLLLTACSTPQPRPTADPAPPDTVSVEGARALRLATGEIVVISRLRLNGHHHAIEARSVPISTTQVPSWVPTDETGTTETGTALDVVAIREEGQLAPGMPAKHAADDGCFDSVEIPLTLEESVTSVVVVLPSSGRMLRVGIPDGEGGHVYLSWAIDGPQWRWRRS